MIKKPTKEQTQSIFLQTDLIDQHKLKYILIVVRFKKCKHF